jgi:hypothetical protein
MVRLLTGTPFSIDAHAINSFESIVDGEVTDLDQGVSINGQASWGLTVVFHP